MQQIKRSPFIGGVLGEEKKYIFLFFVKIILQFGIGLKGLSLPLKLSSQATFSGALIKILSIFLDLIFFFKKLAVDPLNLIDGFPNLLFDISIFLLSISYFILVLEELESTKK